MLVIYEGCLECMKQDDNIYAQLLKVQIVLFILLWFRITNS
jgi:hypothetical protein